ncbi:nucleotidyltransferase substrate binding protein [Desulforegula conservatrix]|uniref:nucleotidyltransferase substrate binding protein n=1 Tax=Desulforegula conservatrix TaxID=153026 RepID=UPI0004142D97|nr:nucleotidyltransferase substrate binding protein [Desulforegula conservatrix]
MTNSDTRWQQRFSNYGKALSQLTEAVELSKEKKLSKIEQQGLIKEFEFTHELAWNVIKDFFEYQGNISIMGSRDATREAFQKGLVTEGEGWMEMIKSRNQTSHTYNHEIADEIAEKIINHYHGLFLSFEKKILDLKND